MLGVGGVWACGWDLGCATTRSFAEVTPRGGDAAGDEQSTRWVDGIDWSGPAPFQRVTPGGHAARRNSAPTAQPHRLVTTRSLSVAVRLLSSCACLRAGA